MLPALEKEIIDLPVRCMSLFDAEDVLKKAGYRVGRVTQCGILLELYMYCPAIMIDKREDEVRELLAGSLFKIWSNKNTETIYIK